MKERTSLFILSRIKKNPVFLYRFENSEQWIKRLEKGSLKAKYGNDMSSDILNPLKQELYAITGEAVNWWAGERHFILRFLFSALVFLGAFFFFSYVVKDPLPVVDEIVLSVLASLVFYYWFLKRSQNGEDSVLKKGELKGIIDRTLLEGDPLLKEAELYLEALDERESRDLMVLMLDENDPALPFESDDELIEFWSLLRFKLGKKRIRKFELTLKRIKKSPSEVILEAFRLWRDNEDIELIYLERLLSRKLAV